MCGGDGEVGGECLAGCMSDHASEWPGRWIVT